MNKEKEYAMSEVEGLVPILRFPEFSNEKTWVKDTLGALTNVISNRNKENKKLPVYSINNKEGFLPQGEQFEGISSTERNYDISLYKVIERNTFAYNPARINVGSIGYSGDLDNIIISSLYVCFKTTEKVNDEFLLQFIKTPYFNKEVENNVEGGIRNYLFYQNFSNILIPIPSLGEQQKIASCLSSLDELIAAHNDKLEALKDHKKGLMQNLFPQEGETMPTYRFPEFEGGGEWVEKKLGEVAELTSSKRVHLADYVESGIPFFRGKEISELKKGIVPTDILFISEEQYSEIKDKYDIPKVGDILITAVGTLGNVYRITTDNKFYFKDGNLIWMRSVSVDSSFLEFLLEARKQDVLATAIGSSQKALTMKALNDLILSFPKKPKEQVKIASCLSAVDKLITAQAEKIAELQQHKKGLTQGLFPKMKD